jgi:hypothetical protein
MTDRRLDMVKNELVKNQERLRELGVEYAEAKKVPPLPEKVDQLLELILQFDPVGNPPTTAVFLFGSARVLVEQIRHSQEVVQEYEELEKRCIKAGELIANEEQNKAATLVDTTGKPVL